jgi:hypothetical protein
VHPTRLWVPQKYFRNFQGIQVEFSPSCLPAAEDSPKRLPEWMTVIASVSVPEFPESTVSQCLVIKSLMVAHIIDNCITLRHQASDRRGVRYFAVIAAQINPKRSNMHLKLVEAEKADAVQQCIQVVREPTP